MSKADIAWAAIIGGGLAYEAYTLRTRRSADTLSETTRRWFRVHKSPGRAAFLVAWGSFSAWFAWHILG